MQDDVLKHKPPSSSRKSLSFEDEGFVFVLCEYVFINFQLLKYILNKILITSNFVELYTI